MSQSIRFLGLAIFAWAGVRAVSLGLVPGTRALAFDLPIARIGNRSQLLPPVRPTLIPPIEPLGQASPPVIPVPAYEAYGGVSPYPAYAPVPIYVSVSTQAPRVNFPQVSYVFAGHPAPVPQQALAEPEVAGQRAQLDIIPVSAPGAVQTTPEIGDAQGFGPFDRLQLGSWALLRQARGEPALANAGTLGGSQAGARLLWFPDPHLAASLRTSSPVNSQRGGEVALGVRYQPLMSVPVALSAERRQAFGRLGGRSGFAAFLEGGVYDRPLPQGLQLNSYFQGGVVGPRHRLWFVDGSAAITRPAWHNVSAGGGIWGGAQPKLTRLDAGPRVTVRVGRRMRVHADYRQKIAGNAAPGSGAVLTIAGDF